MINTLLPPPDLPDSWGIGELSQSFALCYLASYTNASTATRSHLCLSRAYGISQFVFLPRVEWSRPAMVVAKTEYPWGKHVTIAVEGMSSFMQLYSRLTTPGSAALVGNPGGRSMEAFVDLRDECEAFLATSAPVVAWLAERTTVVTFAGYSMGAAVADLMAARFQNDNPTRSVRLRKFSAPRCGNRIFYNNRSPRISAFCLYNAGDLIMHLPTFTMVQRGLQAVFFPGPITWMEHDPAARFVDSRGRQTHDLPMFNPVYANNMINAFITGIGENTWVRPHRMNSYRHLITGLCFHSANPMDYWRFRFLEWPDDDLWQLNWVDAEDWDQNWIGIGAPANYEFQVPQPELEFRLHNARPAPTLPPQPQPMLERLEGRWNVPDPIQINGRRRLRQAPMGG